MQLIFIFSKSFDIDMCPLPFTLEKMYCFISERFTDPSAYVQEQALQWLQVSIYVYLNKTWTRLAPGIYLVDGAVIYVLDGIAYILPSRFSRIEQVHG